MTGRSRVIGLLLALGLLTTTGCLVGYVGWSGPRVWTDRVTEQMPLDAANLETLKVRTHNGRITFEGQTGGESDAAISVTKRAGGWSAGDAEEALAAIDVYVEPDGSSGQRIGWRWKRPKRASWSANVSFAVRAPARIRFDGATHNGSVQIRGAHGTVHVTTHNGSVDVESTGGTLFAATHNGSVTARYSGEEVKLITHNGRVVADLSGCGALDGRIMTHNGRVEVTLGKQASAKLTCGTHNGGIQCDLPLQNVQVRRRRLTGTLGAGAGRLVVSTHNGAVHLKSAL